MRIQVNQEILDFEGKPLLINPKDPKSESIKLKDIIGNSINNTLQSEQLSAEVKNKLFQIGLKLYKGNEVDFTTDQLSLIKERVNKIYQNPLICGRVEEIIEGKPELSPESN